MVFKGAILNNKRRTAGRVQFVCRQIQLSRSRSLARLLACLSTQSKLQLQRRRRRRRDSCSLANSARFACIKSRASKTLIVRLRAQQTSWLRIANQNWPPSQAIAIASGRQQTADYRRPTIASVGEQKQWQQQQQRPDLWPRFLGLPHTESSLCGAHNSCCGLAFKATRAR